MTTTQIYYLYIIHRTCSTLAVRHLLHLRACGPMNMCVCICCYILFFINLVFFCILFFCHRHHHQRVSPRFFCSSSLCIALLLLCVAMPFWIDFSSFFCVRMHKIWEQLDHFFFLLKKCMWSTSNSLTMTSYEHDTIIQSIHLKCMSFDPIADSEIALVKRKQRSMPMPARENRNETQKNNEHYYACMCVSEFFPLTVQWSVRFKKMIYRMCIIWKFCDEFKF